MLQHGSRKHTNYISITLSLLLVLNLAVGWTAEAVQQQQWQQQQQQQVQRALSSSLPIIDGWTSLKTSTHLAYAWKHELQYIESKGSSSNRESTNSSSIGGDSSNSTATNSTLRVHRRGSALAHLHTNITRTVTQAKFSLSGALRVTNPDRIASLLVDKLQVQCQWGLSVVLPCTPQQQHPWQGANPGVSSSSSSSGATGTPESPRLLINPGQTALCSVRGLPIPAEWGSNFKQSCRVLATTAAGAAAQSGHFMLNFASPDVMSLKNDCVRLSTKCEVTGSTFYQTPGVGEQLQQGVLVCEDKELESSVIVNDVYGLEGEMPDGCRGVTKLSCSSDITTLPASVKDADKAAFSQPAAQHLRSGGSSSSSTGTAKLSSSSVLVDIKPAECDAADASASELLPESGELQEGEEGTEEAEGDLNPVPNDAPNSKNPGHMRPPKVSLHIDGTYIVSNYTWLISTSVAPESLKVYANSTAAAQYSVTALRVPVRPSVPPSYYVEGTITVQNNNARAIDVAGVSAILPWGQTALCKPDDEVFFPAKIDASSKLTCTFRLKYELGLKPSSLRAQVYLVGAQQPTKSWPKPFKFNKANLAYSAGACARVAIAFATDVTDLSVTHAGGDAPGFTAAGTEVCEEYNKWDFTVLVTPVGKVDGFATVLSNAVVTPTTLPGADPTSALSRSAVTALSVEVAPWLLPESAPLLTAAGSWRRGGEVPIVSAAGGADEYLWGVRNESVTIKVNI